LVDQPIFFLGLSAAYLLAAFVGSYTLQVLGAATQHLWAFHCYLPPMGILALLGFYCSVDIIGGFVQVGRLLFKYLNFSNAKP
jgi:Flp pilus assembly protein protease CpaA